MGKALWWWLILVAYLIFMIEGAIVRGSDFMTDPLDIAQWLADFVYAFMGVTALIGAGLYVRNLVNYYERLNFQEKFFRRGAVMIYIGGAVAYLIHVFNNDATVTFATPIVLIGYLMLIYPVLGTAVRQEQEDQIIALLTQKKEDEDGSSS